MDVEIIPCIVGDADVASPAEKPSVDSRKQAYTNRSSSLQRRATQRLCQKWKSGRGLVYLWESCHANVGCLDDDNASSKEKLVVKEVVTEV